MFRGSIVATATPFHKETIDEDQLRKLIQFQIKNGTDGIVPCGTTGESPTLSYKEHYRVIEICIEEVKGRVPVIAGTGSNSTAEAIELTEHAKASGADAALIVSPYYNRPTQEGLYLHFKKIADTVKIPIIIYNIAGRTGVNIETPTLARLAKNCKNIVGVKEASGSVSQMMDVKAACGDKFDLMSGDDVLTLPLLSIGGTGIISVVANIIPRDVAKMVKLFEKGDLAGAKKLHYQMLPLVKAMFLETNPVPVKTAMGMMGLCSDEVRLPLCEMTSGNKEKLKQALKEYGLIK
ncbi:MAG: 4-hydroxy-tetrahydrodipicolinate synthase [Candidatus Omnitrophica bacterium]|nr:4-hydroxy-tetrahydrodipicolinate synthase [Candidatus Omnitrophota bacterium]